MKIIGISGLETSVPFKRRSLPGLDEREYRISQGHDSAAALVIDGEIIAAAAEERFNRLKHSGAFPINAINYCLKQGGIALDEIDEIAHAFNYSGLQGLFSLNDESLGLYDQVYSKDALIKLARLHLPQYPVERVFQVSHHLAHAASAYFTSGWNECLVLVMDGMGETDSGTAYNGRDGVLRRIHHISVQDSIGIFYSLITLHLGFDFNSDEYKIMGLAPYGDPSRFRDFFAQTVLLAPDGKISIPALRLNKTYADRQGYLATRSYLAKHLVPARPPEADIEEVHRDIAAALQECLDNVMLHISGHLARKTGLRRLAMAGGVTLNCTANGRILQSGLFDDIYIQPAAGDDGAALGAALLRASRREEARNRRMPVPFLGPSYSTAEIDAAVQSFGERIEVTSFTSFADTCDAAATLIADGHVIAWFRGRMEFGPRALGHRSILADPSRPEMRDRINAMVKMREAFRPFAPAVTIEEAHKWFQVEQARSLALEFNSLELYASPAGRALTDLRPHGSQPLLTSYATATQAASTTSVSAPESIRYREFPYMITTVDVSAEYRDELPAITHVNGSARLQTVSETDNLDFHTLLKAVGVVTGREMVLNTSFNIKGQPIVNTPAEAIETFLSTGIDHLFMENLLISRRRQQQNGGRNQRRRAS
jgi:carbamoyltransferase